VICQAIWPFMLMTTAICLIAGEPAVKLCLKVGHRQCLEARGREVRRPLSTPRSADAVVVVEISSIIPKTIGRRNRNKNVRTQAKASASADTDMDSSKSSIRSSARSFVRHWRNCFRLTQRLCESYGRDQRDCDREKIGEKND
jgi:hypothetical protein